MIWFAAAPLVGRAAKVVIVLVTSLVCVLLMGMPMLGILLQPLSPWWLSGKATLTVGDAPAGAVPITMPDSPVALPAGAVSDVQRYLLAIGAGFSPTETIIAVAISIAEDGSGDPAALSGRNSDGSRDLGLWQINSGWWPQFGGQAALANPVTNALAAHYVYQRQGWCAWSTYERSCGGGHTGSYGAYIGRAHAAAGGH